jgi:hypothetical protein
MGRIRPKHYTFEVINKVRHFEDLAKSTREAPKKFWIKEMPGSPKKNSKSGEAAAMPNTRQQESTRREREREAASAAAPALPPRGQPVVPMTGTASKPPQQKRNSRDEEDVTMEQEPAYTAPKARVVSRDDTYRDIVGQLAQIGNEYPELKNRVAELMKNINKVLNETIQRTKDETKAETFQELEDKKCSDSLVLYNVQNMAYPRNSCYDKVRPEEAIMDALKKMTRHMATILSVVTMARTEEGFPMTVKVVLSDPMQKGTLFRSLAYAKVEMPELYEMFRGVTFRDCFPRRHREEVKKLVAEGLEMKNAGEVAAFRVVARGPSCNPVLQKKMKNSIKWQEHIKRRN